MNIIFTTISMRGGGTERVISILANRLVNRGHNVTILMIADPTIEYSLDERVQTLGITDTVGGSMSGRIKRLREIRRIVKEAYRHITADSCIEANGDTRVIAMGTVASMFTLLATLGLRVPIIISERNDPNRLNHRPIKPIERMLRDLLYARAARIVLQTRDAISCFSGKTARNCVIIPNPLPEAMPAPGDVNKRAKSIITAGRLTEQKNHKLLIEVFGRIADILPEYELKIFGKGELEDELQKLINEKGLICVASATISTVSLLPVEYMYLLQTGKEYPIHLWRLSQWEYLLLQPTAPWEARVCVFAMVRMASW